MTDMLCDRDESKMVYCRTRMLCGGCLQRAQKWLGPESMRRIGWEKRGECWWCPICTGHFNLRGTDMSAGGTE